MPQTKPPRQEISIHALREEGDLGPCLHQLNVLQFLSTPSARRATGSAGTEGTPPI